MRRRWPWRMTRRRRTRRRECLGGRKESERGSGWVEESADSRTRLVVYLPACVCDSEAVIGRVPGGTVRVSHRIPLIPFL